jgi:hypothetical protein
MALSRRQRLTQVTRDAVKAAAAKYLDADRVRIVVVGDGAALKEPLAALGWGAVEQRGPDGAVVPAGSKRGVESLAKGR